MTNPVTTILYTGLSLLLISPAASAEEFMPAADVKSALSGKTCSGDHLRKDFTFKVHFSSDGTVHQVKRNGDTNTGQWSVLDNGKRCLEWNGSDVRKCFNVRDNGDMTYTLVKIRGNGETRDLINWSDCKTGNMLGGS